MYDYEKAKKKVMVAKELLQEIEDEINYNEGYRLALLEHRCCEKEFYDKFTRDVRFSVIKDNCKTIRRILLEVSK